QPAYALERAVSEQPVISGGQAEAADQIRDDRHRRIQHRQPWPQATGTATTRTTNGPITNAHMVTSPAQVRGASHNGRGPGRGPLLIPKSPDRVGTGCFHAVPA